MKRNVNIFVYFVTLNSKVHVSGIKNDIINATLCYFRTFTMLQKETYSLKEIRLKYINKCLNVLNVYLYIA